MTQEASAIGRASRGVTCGAEIRFPYSRIIRRFEVIVVKGRIRAEKPLSGQTLVRKTRLTQAHKISRERMGSELDFGRTPWASVSRGCCTSSREGRKAQPVIHSPWAAFEGWRVAWVRHPFGNSDQAKAPRRTVAKLTAWAMSHGPWNAHAGFKPESF